MVEEFVRTGQFDEYSRRVDERFVALEKKMEQGFAHAAKEREQNFAHVNQRFDDMKESVNQRFDTLEKMVLWQNRITMGILLVILAAALKYLFLPG